MGTIRESVGEWIAIRRDELGMTYPELARRLGVDNKTVYNVERGKSAVGANKARWEDALRWRRGSLTRAYMRGIEPEPVDGLDVPARPGETAERLRTITVTEEQYQALMALWEQLDQQYPRRRNDEDEDRLA